MPDLQKQPFLRDFLFTDDTPLSMKTASSALFQSTGWLYNIPHFVNNSVTGSNTHAKQKKIIKGGDLVNG